MYDCEASSGLEYRQPVAELLNDADEDRERLLLELAWDPGLTGDSERRFARRRAEIHRHHGQWRINLPAMDNLFDDDSHRAKALAANLATELEQTMTAWVRVCAEAPGQRLSGAETRRRLDLLAQQWVTVATRFRDAEAWGEEACSSFDDFLQELLVRARGRAWSEFEAVYSARTAKRPVGRLAAALRKGLRRLFHPETV